MSEIKIKSASKQITGWSKRIIFEREGETYDVNLYWNNQDGCELVFHNSNSTPEWAITEYGTAAGLELLLDEMTEGEDK